MRVIVTRVQPQGARWVDALQREGHDALALPLIEVTGLRDAAALVAARQRWPDYAAVMFVSSHAVECFFAAGPAFDMNPSPVALPRVWCTGPGTRAALLRQGLPSQRVDCPPDDDGHFDSEALWQQVSTQVRPGTPVLIVRGNTVVGAAGAGDSAPEPAHGLTADPGIGRDWLAQRLRQAGAQVDFVVAYQRGAPAWTAAQREQAVTAARDGSIWLFSSAEAVDNLRMLLPGQDWSGARALVTHSRIAVAARRAGFRSVTESLATLPAVLASLESCP